MILATFDQIFYVCVLHIIDFAIRATLKAISLSCDND